MFTRPHHFSECKSTFIALKFILYHHIITDLVRGIYGLLAMLDGSTKTRTHDCACSEFKRVAITYYKNIIIEKVLSWRCRWSVVAITNSKKQRRTVSKTNINFCVPGIINVPPKAFTHFHRYRHLSRSYSY